MEKDFLPFIPEEFMNPTKETIIADSVFDFILGIADPIKQQRALGEARDKARSLGAIQTFNALLKAYQQQRTQKLKQQGSNVMKFTDSPLPELKCGTWDCTNLGVSRTTLQMGIPNRITACPHPILPVERLVNMDDGTEKVKLAFLKDKIWNTVIVNRSVTANKGNIVMLADRGIEVNSESAKELVSYISDVVALNMQEIPVYKSIGRMGWVGEKFAPYINDIRFDGDIQMGEIYNNFRTSGNYEAWIEEAKHSRKFSKVARLMIDAALASPLLSKVGTLSYIVHVWGGTGVGKTVGLMLAASIWGNPEIGGLVRSLNSTQFAIGRMCGFLQNLPFIADELQTIKDKWNSWDNLIMHVCEGVDRNRGKGNGGMEELRRWKLASIFTGEEPITKASSGGGAKNRVIEIECVEKVVENGNYTSNFLRENYGFAGKDFIEHLPSDDQLKKRYQELFRAILDATDTNDKQAMAMATILLADELACEIIFKDEPLTVSDVVEFLQSKKDVDVAARAYDWVLSWVLQNQNRFEFDGNGGEVYGKLERLDEKDPKSDVMSATVSKEILDAALKKQGFDYNAIIRKWSERGHIEKNSQGRFFHHTRVYGIKGYYVKILFNSEEPMTVNDDDDLPFERNV